MEHFKETMEISKNEILLSKLGSFPPITLKEMSAIRLMNRTDTKFLTDKKTFMRLLESLKNDYYVQQIEEERISNYRTIYWDTPDHVFYLCHHNGCAPRRKIRIRTYMDSDITFLEVKRKDNHGKTRKVRIPMNEMESLEVIGEDFIKEHTQYSFDSLIPCLENQFHRITFVNKGKTERLTVDFDINFHNIETKENRAMNNLVIIELKRDGWIESPVMERLLHLRIKPNGFSKYCIGSYLTNPLLKRNLFKSKILFINKIEQE